jgi:hypothetical protein
MYVYLCIYNIIYDIKSPANFSWITQTFQVLSGGFVEKTQKKTPQSYRIILIFSEPRRLNVVVDNTNPF